MERGIIANCNCAGTKLRTLLPEKFNTYLNAGGVAVLVDVINATSIEGGRTADDAVNLGVLKVGERSLSNWDIAIGNRQSAFCVSKESSIICAKGIASPATPPPMNARNPKQTYGPNGEALLGAMTFHFIGDRDFHRRHLV